MHCVPAEDVAIADRAGVMIQNQASLRIIAAADAETPLLLWPDPFRTAQF